VFSIVTTICFQSIIGCLCLAKLSMPCSIVIKSKIVVQDVVWKSLEERLKYREFKLCKYGLLFLFVNKHFSWE